MLTLRCLFTASCFFRILSAQTRRKLYGFLLKQCARGCGKPAVHDGSLAECLIFTKIY